MQEARRPVAPSSLYRVVARAVKFGLWAQFTCAQGDGNPMHRGNSVDFRKQDGEAMPGTGCQGAARFAHGWRLRLCSQVGDSADRDEGAVAALVGVGGIDPNFPVEDAAYVLQSLVCVALY